MTNISYAWYPAWFLAASPINLWSFVKATQEGVILFPWSLWMISTWVLFLLYCNTRVCCAQVYSHNKSFIIPRHEYVVGRFSSWLTLFNIVETLRFCLVREFWRGEEEIFNLKCLVQFLEGEGRGANFIALSKLSLY